eukprot:TRINITY_DN17476_c0_g1_i1.p1 TRINITY_DN17476_c0_g1~~TRINITY_DN17476_c0_g1_i1.p1  ORF type:complete len:408 (+),score=79.78 TRINITY_DN17476_c0_g1_i1:90-1313(+)
MSVASDAIDPTTGLSQSSKTQVEVTEPFKQGEGVNAYISYKVKTNSTLSTFKSGQSEVIRRFSDFDFMDSQIKQQYKGVIVPPLPEKDVIQKYKYNQEFIEKRRRALQVYINRVANHPELYKTKEVQLFLEASEQDWWQHKRLYKHEENAQKSTVGQTMQFLKGIAHTTTNLVQGRSVEAEEDPEYLRIREYVFQLEKHLSDTYRRASDLVNKQQALGGALSDFGDAADKLGKFEQPRLQEAFSQLGRHAGDLSRGNGEHADKMYATFEAPLKEFYRMVRSVKQTMTDRATALTQVSQAKADMEAKNAKVARCKGTPGIRHDKIIDAQRELDEATKKHEEAKQKYIDITSKMSSELARFQQERSVEMASVLRDFAVNQARAAGESAKQWGTLLSQLQQSKANGATVM